jgi:hypothetical protein
MSIWSLPMGFYIGLSEANVQPFAGLMPLILHGIAE